LTANSEASPEERIRAFLVAVDEELVRPARRYLRGVRRGLLLGCLLGILFAPVAGRENRRRLGRLIEGGRRLRPGRAARRQV
jgi:hypothetical protein